jgi:chromosome segregation ATPase
VKEAKMWKRGIEAVVLALAAVAVAFVSPLLAPAAYGEGEGDGAIADKLAQLEAGLAKLEGIVKDIAFDAQRISSLEAILKEISFQMKESEGKIRDLSAFQRSVEEDLRPRVVKLESSVSGLSFTVQKQGEKLTKLEGLSEAVAELQPRVFSLETTVQGIAAKLKTDEEQLKQLYLQANDLQKRVETLEKAMAQAQAQLQLIGKPEDLSKLQELMNRLGLVESTVGGLSAKLKQQGETLIGHEGLISAQADEIAALKKEITALKGQARTMVLVAVGGLLAGLAALALHFMA